MSVFVGPSIWREINVLTASRLLQAMQGAPNAERVIWAPLWNDALIGRSRSIMCTEFLKTDADVMVIIDDDIVFDAADFWKIVEGARETRSIYGGAYVTRSTSPHLTSRMLPNTNVGFTASPVRNPVEIQYLATGFFAIHRDVMQAMVDAEFTDADGKHVLASCELGADRPFYPFFSPFQVIEDDGKRHYLSEDWAFCNRARQLDFKVWMDASIILQHMGLYPYTVADLDNPGNAFPSRGIEYTELNAGKLYTGFRLVDTLADDIAEWSEEPIGAVKRMISQGPEDTARLYREKPIWEPDAEWYRREDVGLAYICDLANWHMQGLGAWGIAAGEVDGQRILDYGGGIATWSLLAAERGAHVTVLEPNPVMREFAQWRAEKYGLTDRITILDTDAEVGEFDVVVAWHVFEHLPYPEATLDRLLTMLAPGGRLLSESGFDDHAPEQHREHADWSGVLRQRGLVETSPAVYELMAAVAA